MAGSIPFEAKIAIIDLYSIPLPSYAGLNLQHPQQYSCFAITTPGLETVTWKELVEIGITDAKAISGGVTWVGDLESVYLANIWSRTSSRIIVRVAAFSANNFPKLEREAKKVPWARLLPGSGAISLRVTTKKSRLYHSDAVAERFQRVISAAMPGVTFTAPAEDDDAQLVLIRLERDNVVVSVDSSGQLLHRRGYRQAVAKAPLRETIAAAMLIGIGWDRVSPLLDPMCGSGTIPIEAALMARNIAPGKNRDFAFMRWPDFNRSLWDRVRAESVASELPVINTKILGSDRDNGAISASIANAERAGVAANIHFSTGAISSIQTLASDLLAGERTVTILTNPPYGSRVGDSTVRNLYAQFGKVLRDSFQHSTIGLLSPDRALERQTRIALRPVFSISNGGIPVRLMQGVLENNR